MGTLTHKQRKGMHTYSFALRKERKYPIQDISHARNALARVSAHGSNVEKHRVRQAVYRRYPGLKPSKRGR